MKLAQFFSFPFSSTVYLVLILYLGAATFLYVKQRQFIYFPTAPAQPAVRLNPTLHAFSLSHNDITLRGFVSHPGQKNALIYFGGNAEPLEENIPFAQSLLQDHSTYFVYYRGYSSSDGEPSESALYQDALAIYDNIVAHHESIRVMGRSLGSGVATYLAANRKVDKLVLTTPYDSIENVAQSNYWAFPIYILLKDKFLSYKNIPQISADTLILVASDDETIPRKSTDALIKCFPEKQLNTTHFPNTSHNTISSAPNYYNAIIAFLNRNSQ